MTKLQRMMTSGLKQLMGEWKTIKFDIFVHGSPILKRQHCRITVKKQIFSRSTALLFFLLLRLGVYIPKALTVYAQHFVKKV